MNGPVNSPDLSVTESAIPDVKIIVPAKAGDRRGFLSETFNRERWAENGCRFEFVQENHTLSPTRGTIRGLHYQIAPAAQAKVVRVVRGAIYDVAVDLRRGSPTFGKWVGTVLSAAQWNQIAVPVGFAHGFCTLEPDTEVLYKLTAHWSPEHERGIRWDDAALAIDWPKLSEPPLVSNRDRRWPALADQPDLFE